MRSLVHSKGKAQAPLTRFIQKISDKSNRIAITADYPLSNSVPICELGCGCLGRQQKNRKI
jgi:exoribonuclease II